MMNRYTKEELISQDKEIAEFIGFKYFPFDKSNIQQAEYPGWFDLSKCPPINENDEVRLFTYKSPTFVCRKTKDLRFLVDWNMLMKAVEKIESIESRKYGGFNVHIGSDVCLIQSNNRTKESSYSRSYCSSGNKKVAVYESVLLFINFYKSL